MLTHYYLPSFYVTPGWSENVMMFYVQLCYFCVVVEKTIDPNGIAAYDVCLNPPPPNNTESPLCFYNY